MASAAAAAAVAAPNRLIDYFVVTGIGDSLNLDQNRAIANIDVCNNVYKAEIIDRYPRENYPDAPLPKHVWMFCFPGGVQLQREIATREPRFFVITLTDIDGTRFYGACLTTYRPINPHELLMQQNQQRRKTELPSAPERTEGSESDLTIAEKSGATPGTRTRSSTANSTPIPETSTPGKVELASVTTAATASTTPASATTPTSASTAQSTSASALPPPHQSASTPSASELLHSGSTAASTPSSSTSSATSTSSSSSSSSSSISTAAATNITTEIASAPSTVSSSPSLDNLGSEVATIELPVADPSQSESQSQLTSTASTVPNGVVVTPIDGELTAEVIHATEMPTSPSVVVTTADAPDQSPPPPATRTQIDGASTSEDDRATDDASIPKISTSSSMPEDINLMVSADEDDAGGDPFAPSASKRRRKHSTPSSSTLASSTASSADTKKRDKRDHDKKRHRSSKKSKSSDGESSGKPRSRRSSRSSDSAMSDSMIEPITTEPGASSNPTTTTTNASSATNGATASAGVPSIAISVTQVPPSGADTSTEQSSNSTQLVPASDQRSSSGTLTTPRHDGPDDSGPVTPRRAAEQQKQRVADKRDNEIVYAPQCICILSHHPFYSTFREVQQTCHAVACCVLSLLTASWLGLRRFYESSIS